MRKLHAFGALLALLFVSLPVFAQNPIGHSWTPGAGGGTVEFFGGSLPFRIYRQEASVWTELENRSPLNSRTLVVTDQPLGTFQYRALGANVTGGATAGYPFSISVSPPPGPFADVPSTYWAVASIQWAADNGITGGCGGGNFCPEQAVTRAQLMVFLQRLFNLVTTGSASSNGEPPAEQ